MLRVDSRFHMNTAFLIGMNEKGGVFMLRSTKCSISILIGVLFCAIIWTSPDSAVSVSAQESCGPVLIVDPGHGGEDGGAVALDGTAESTINLDISQRLRDLACFMGLQVVMTRDSSELEYPPSAVTTAQRKRWDTQRRMELINGYKDAILVSIHQNTYPTPTPRGSQVLYGHAGDSEFLGKLLHRNLIAALDPQNRRVAVPADRDIYIMKHADCTAVLVECGFLSHPEESGLLNSNSYRLKVATVMAGTLLQYTEDNDEREDRILLHGVRQ